MLACAPSNTNLSHKTTTCPTSPPAPQHRARTHTGSWPSQQQLPIVYHPHYNITLWGIEKLHPFDSCKFSKVVSGLQQNGIISGPQQLVRPMAVSYELLGQVHTQEYLQQLQTSSLKVAQVIESGWREGLLV